MVTRQEKRDLEKDINYLFELVKMQKHLFKDFKNYMKKVKDPRHQSYITYTSDTLLFMMVLKNACNLTTMRSMTDHLNRDECIKNVGKVLDRELLGELPHYDTINDFLSALNPDELSSIRTYMIRELLQKRSLEQFRINGKYWGVIIDGTGLFTFDKKHCDHCLRRVYTDQETGEKTTIYMHHVLEAKLVVGNMVLSLDSEFIENESEDTPKQDCELNAFYRLAQRIKTTYKRLPICIIADSLYACDGVFRQCEANRWHYLFRLKEGRLKSVMEEFQELKQIEGRSGDMFGINDIAYGNHDVNVLEGSVETENGRRQYTFITDIKINGKNIRGLLNAGRSRWKIENEGFNKQKNILYNIEHANSHNYTAMKNHYILTQITDILIQLFHRGAKIFKNSRKTAKEISSNLLESFRTRYLTDEDIQKTNKPIQVRLT